MKTEKEYADELIEQYMVALAPCDGISDDWIQCAIIDVTNTIKAIENIVKLEYGHTSIDIGQTYYQTVLQILKERL